MIEKFENLDSCFQKTTEEAQLKEEEILDLRAKIGSLENDLQIAEQGADRKVVLVKENLEVFYLTSMSFVKSFQSCLPTS